MRQFLLLTPLLLGACTAPVAATHSTAAPAPQPQPPAEPQRVSAIPPEPNAISNPQTFVCHASVRRLSVHDSQKSMEEIRMSEPGDRSVSSGAFRFRVLYWDSRYDGRALLTYVYSTSTGKLIEQSLFQLDRQKGPVNQINGGNDFTGLRYVHAPDSDAELQYWCRSG